MMRSQCQAPRTPHFLEGKYIQRAWMFLFLIPGRKRGAKQPLLKQCLNITPSMCVVLTNTILSLGKQNGSKHCLTRQILMSFLEAAQMQMQNSNRPACAHVLRHVTCAHPAYTSKFGNILRLICIESHT